ncbi:hypothetical protein B0I35DRAFT_485359 [Stachybotrys elegans]|uniref:Uncharacterized protein n=1 Tax=Stachybotrys elegans TaxID=80388 RepID=A0A8K0WJR6_9HYPO|nr:hypothetical protein B0I35DRAFT_485359 [Stachybotrys elegans]
MASTQITGGSDAQVRELCVQYAPGPFASFLKKASSTRTSSQIPSFRAPLEFRIYLMDRAEPFARFVFGPVCGELADDTEPIRGDLLFANMLDMFEAVDADMWASFGHVPQILAIDVHGCEKPIKSYMFLMSKSYATKSDSVDLVFVNYDDAYAASVDPENCYNALYYSWKLRKGQELPGLKV